MTVANVKAVFDSDIQTVWETVTSLEHYAWRSDLSKIEVLSETEFIEYTKEGYATTFTTTVFEPYKRWEFDLETGNMQGHWCGVFCPKGAQTEIDFTETVTAKKLFIRPFVKTFLKKQQAQYIADLRKALL